MLWLASGCGQNEGGRCQVTSDCASGLVCVGGDTGNGVCRAQTSPGTTDAALPPDVAPDRSPASGPETQAPGFDAEPDAADVAAPPVDTGTLPLDAEADAPSAEAGLPSVDAEPAIDVRTAIDSRAMDATAID